MKFALVNNNTKSLLKVSLVENMQVKCYLIKVAKSFASLANNREPTLTLITIWRFITKE